MPAPSCTSTQPSLACWLLCTHHQIHFWGVGDLHLLQRGKCPLSLNAIATLMNMYIHWTKSNIRFIPRFLLRAPGRFGWGADSQGPTAAAPLPVQKGCHQARTQRSCLSPQSCFHGASRPLGSPTPAPCFPTVVSLRQMQRKATREKERNQELRRLQEEARKEEGLRLTQRLQELQRDKNLLLVGEVGAGLVGE